MAQHTIGPPVLRPRLGRLRAGLAALLVAFALAAALAAPAWAGSHIVNVHEARKVLWAQQRPRTVEDLKRIKELGIAQEKATRKPVLDELKDFLAKNGFSPPGDSGTPPHTKGSSGVLTDIDDLFPEERDVKAAADWFERKGYKVKWNTEDTFSVRELDYTGFAKKRPKMRPGSAREIKYLREAAVFPDKVWTVGSQEWVNGPVNIGAQKKLIGETRKDLLDDLARLAPGQAAERQAIASKLDELKRALDVLDDKLAKFAVSDSVGFTTDMMNKAVNHMDPKKWGPMSGRFGYWEDPRQAAKAAARALEELPGGPGAHSGLMNSLDAVAKGNAIPDEGLRGRVNKAFHEAFKTAVEADQNVDDALVAAYRAAVEGGDAAAISQARHKLMIRQHAARRIEATFQAVSEAGDSLDARVVLLALHAGVIRPSVVERYGLEAG